MLWSAGVCFFGLFGLHVDVDEQAVELGILEFVRKGSLFAVLAVVDWKGDPRVSDAADAHPTSI